MNTSIRSESASRPRSAATTATAPKNKNIREIYLESVNRHRGSKKGGRLKTANISHIEGGDPGVASSSSSGYLASEYTLVKRILTATKALEKLKTSSGAESEAAASANGVSLKQSLQKTDLLI